MENRTDTNDLSDLTEYARMLKALGEPTRLRIFQFLRSCCHPVSVEDSGDVRPVQHSPTVGEGGGDSRPPTVGAVCCHLNGDEKVNPNVSFHLKELRNAGLITMERRGKNMLCAVDPKVPERLAAFFGGDNLPGGCCPAGAQRQEPKCD